MLRYFGEDKCSTWRCGSCDLCQRVASSITPLDISNDAAKLLAAVQQVSNLRCAMGGGFESFQSVLLALSGKSPHGACDVVSLEDLPCFGTGANRSSKFWEGLKRMFLNADLLV